MALRMRKSNKYRAVRTTVDGIRFDSKREASRYLELQMREKAGEIRDLQRQVSFPLRCDVHPILIRSKGYPNGRQARYVADFTYWVVGTGEYVVEDVKGGIDTPAGRLKRAVLEAMSGIVVQVIR
jgi:hypothetical protein